jgi:hypothetical protein
MTPAECGNGYPASDRRAIFIFSSRWALAKTSGFSLRSAQSVAAHRSQVSPTIRMGIAGSFQNLIFILSWSVSNKPSDMLLLIFDPFTDGFASVMMKYSLSVPIYFERCALQSGRVYVPR